MSRVVLLAGILALSSACETAPAAVKAAPVQHSQKTRLAVTVDDLPGTDQWPGWSRARLLDGLVEILQKHGVPSPVGFFTGSNMDESPETTQALDRWLAAGFRLGNHTYSHQRPVDLGIQGYLADIERNEQVLAAVLRGRKGGVHYFRFPFLERGTPAERALIHAFLEQHGYRVADVSVDYEDWAYADAFSRCTARNDTEALRTLAAEYVENALSELTWSSDTAERVLGRSLPQVLLIHPSPATIQELDSVLAAYEKTGVAFIDLDIALADPVYSELETPDHESVTLIEALIRARRSDVRSFTPRQARLLSLVCR